MEIREIIGRRVTDRDGAAELLGRSPQTVALLSSRKQREQGSGFPAPAPGRLDRKLWFYIDELEAFRDNYVPRVTEANLARVHTISLEGDPDEEIPAVEFRKLIGAESSPWSKYVDISKTAWQQGEDGYLPRPDREEPAPHGMLRFWKRHRVEAWINNRRGSQPAAGRPKTGDNPHTRSTMTT